MPVLFLARRASALGPMVRLGRGAFSALSSGGVVADAEQGGAGAYLRRQRSRLGAPKAITAAAHKLARIVYHLVRFGEAYVKQTEEAYAEQVKERLEKQLRRRAKEMGFEVRKIEAPPAMEAVTEPAPQG